MGIGEAVDLMIASVFECYVDKDTAKVFKILPSVCTKDLNDRVTNEAKSTPI